MCVCVSLSFFRSSFFLEPVVREKEKTVGLFCICHHTVPFGLYVDMSSSGERPDALNGGIVNRGLTEDDWERLHNRVIPNPVPLVQFKQTLTEGKLQDIFLAKDLHKIMQEMRDILREHGELREAASFPLSGRKSDLSRAAAAAVCILNRSTPSESASSGPLARGHLVAPTAEVAKPNSPPRFPSAPPTTTEEAPRLSHTSDSPLLSSPTAEDHPARSGEPPTSENDPARRHADSLSPSTSRRSRALPITDHIGDVAAPQPSEEVMRSTIPARSLSLPPSFPPAPSPLSASPATSRPRTEGEEGGGASGDGTGGGVAGRRWTPNARLASAIAHNAAAAGKSDGVGGERSGLSVRLDGVERTAEATPFAETTRGVSYSGGTGSSSSGSTGMMNELAQLNERAPPFFHILNVIRRFQLRYGSHPLKFEVPVQYAQAVHTRRLRVFLVPFRHPNLPSRWPTAKEIVVYVNDQCVMTPWKRTWPERKTEVAKTFLPLDITQFVSRSSPFQRLQIDVFNKDYFTPAALVVVQPLTLEEVVERLLSERLGCGAATRIEEALTSPDSSATLPPAPQTNAGLVERIHHNDDSVYSFYRDIMEEDVEEGLEMDDPIITTKCPISQMTIEVPMRGHRCRHLQCVDLQSYLVSSSKGAYWNCPLCDSELRPRDVQLDTVLWRFLRGVGASPPPHVRLSKRVPEAGAEARLSGWVYYWHRSRASGADADSIVDSDDEDSKGSSSSTPQQQRGRSGEADEVPAVKPEPPSSPSDTWHGDGGLPPGRLIATGGHKRSREPSPARLAAEDEGTAENPIEL